MQNVRSIKLYVNFNDEEREIDKMRENFINDTSGKLFVKL